jgi:hypothetical protein
MIKVYRIPVPKDRLLALPRDERVLLILLGYVANQILLFQKLLTYATQLDAPTELETHATGTQTQMLVRMATGAVSEAWRLITTRFIENKLQKDYLDLLDPNGRTAFEELKRLFGKSALLTAIRNNYAFHYPTTEEAEQAFQAAAADAEFDDLWKVYFSEHGFNSLFFFSDLVFVHGIGAKAKAQNLVDAQKQLMGELSAASMNIVEFAQAFFAAAWRKNFGDEIPAQDIVNVENAPAIEDVRLPFFVEVKRDSSVVPSRKAEEIAASLGRDPVAES